jgi:hypothetical protein
MPTVAEAIERLKLGNNLEDHVAMAVWCTEDVLGRAKELDIECSQEQAEELIDRIDHKQDCSIGITWDTLDCYLYDLKDECPGCKMPKVVCICQRKDD